MDDIIGWDFVDGDGTPEDRFGHGTHVSGTIAARGDNEIGVIGVAPWAKIMALKGLGDSGAGDAIALANSVRYAADMGADIISASWGGIAPRRPVNAAFRYAHGLGVLSIAAAGNSDADVANFSPANLAEVLAVAATDPDDVRALLLELRNRDRCLGTRCGGFVTQCKRRSECDRGGTPGAHRRRAITSRSMARAWRAPTYPARRPSC